jgi:hypothetical protein
VACQGGGIPSGCYSSRVELKGNAMHDQPTVGKSRLTGTLISLGVFVVVGWIFEHIAHREVFEAALTIQRHWLTVVSAMSPLELAATFPAEISEAWRQAHFTGTPSDFGQLYTLPSKALFGIVAKLWHSSAWFTLLQLVLGAVAVATFNMNSSKGKHIFFHDAHATYAESNFLLNRIFGPLAVIGAASVIALILQIVMFAVLYALSWITGLAATAAGARLPSS